MINFIIFLIVILILEKIIDKLTNNKKINKINGGFSKKDYLLTQNELKFYKLLKNITDKYNLIIFTQVSLYEIINANNLKDFNKIKSKSIDFVITDVNSRIKLCIELDDTTHKKINRQKRDIFINNIFQELEIKLLRIPVQNYYNLKKLEELIIK